MNRCLNDVFGYCSGKPKETVKEGYKTELDYRGRTIAVSCTIQACKLDHHTCPHYQTFTQTYTPRSIRQHCMPLS